MANLIENDKGFLVIKCRTTELMTLERGVMGVCDYCNEATLDGYICCALGHRYYCEKCYKDWMSRAIHYEEDIPYETGVYVYYHSGFVKNELWTETKGSNNECNKTIFRTKGNKMKVLSLFDGISCGRLALERAGIPVEKYYASEIDKYAIQVAQKNYPDTIQVGDVTKLNYLELLDIDMIIGGSPCQDLSIAKQNRQGLRGERSGLFWKYVEALETIRPKYFLLENVASMRNEDRDAITETLRKIYPETECIMINSALVSAQQRKRYYWTNWHVEQPQDKGILLKDILENGESLNNKSHCLDANYYKGTSLEHYSEKRNRELVAVPVGCRMVGRKTDENGVRPDDWDIPTQQRIEINENPQKANCISTVSKDSMVAEPLVPFVQSKLPDIEKKFGELPPMFNPYNKQKITDKAPTQTAQCGSQTNSSTVMIFQPVRVGQIGKGGQGNRIYSVRAKSVCLNANGGGRGAKTGLYKVDLPDGDYIVRKLTPIECERLQTLPDNYTSGISDTQRYKCCGNGWTVDIIAHIFKGLK